jgi:integrase
VDALSKAPWTPEDMLRLQETMLKVREGTQDWTMQDFILHQLRHKRRRPKTVRNYVTQLNFMSDKTRHAMPVVLAGSREEARRNFSAYITMREEIAAETGKAPAKATAIITDHKAIRAWGDFRGIPENVWPTMPEVPAKEPAFVPSPEQVYELLHTDFFPKHSFENYLCRHLLWYSFAIGVRAPSEWLTLRIADVDLPHNLIIVTEDKKRGKRRPLVVTPDWMINSKTRQCLGNWDAAAREGGDGLPVGVCSRGWDTLSFARASRPICQRRRPRRLALLVVPSRRRQTLELRSPAHRVGDGLEPSRQVARPYLSS